MDEPHDDIEDVIANYERQFADSNTASKIVQAQALMDNKLHACTQELIRLALHATKEETRLKAILALQDRVMGKVVAGTENDADDTFKMLEAAQDRRRKAKGQ